MVKSVNARTDGRALESHHIKREQFVHGKGHFDKNAVTMVNATCSHFFFFRYVVFVSRISFTQTSSVSVGPLGIHSLWQAFWC